jgi:hypothetical protein
MKLLDATARMSTKVKHLVLLAAFLTAGLAATPASATPLSMPLQTYPDVTSSFITVQYDAISDAFSANGFVSAYKPNSSTEIDYSNYLFKITASIADNGTFSSGILDMVNMANSTDHLLTGNLVALGFANNDPTMQFLFNNTGGSLESDFGLQSFVTLNYSGFDKTGLGFSDNFDNVAYGDGTSDTQAPAVPEPSTISLLLLGAGGLLLARRRRSPKIA